MGGQVSTSWIILVFLVILGIIINGILQVRQLTINEVLQQKYLLVPPLNLPIEFHDLK